MLYETIGLDLNLKKYPEGIRMAARVSAENDFKNVLSTIDGFAPTGGKRRVSYWKVDDKPYAGWACPEKIRDALSLSSKVRMVLATPAIFSNGWYPDWIKEKGDFLEGTPPGVYQDIKLRLVSACTDRWKPLSGYSLEIKNRGFKALRRLVPSGSVYFFEVAEGNAKDLTDLWLSSVSDEEQDRRDGFGLALWGIWKNFTKVENTKQNQEE
jgi:CRISPR-associated protein Cmr3